MGKKTEEGRHWVVRVYWETEITGTGLDLQSTIRTDVDDMVQKLARRECVGRGTDVIKGTRDMHYEFAQRPAAERFRKRVEDLFFEQLPELDGYVTLEMESMDRQRRREYRAIFADRSLNAPAFQLPWPPRKPSPAAERILKTAKRRLQRKVKPRTKK